MLYKMVYAFIFISGIIVGSGICYIHFYGDSPQHSNNALLTEIFKHANSPIYDDNNACEGETVKTVGAVVASLLTLNTINKINMLEYGCFSDTCTMSVSDCTPWEANECSTRFLKFNIDDKHKINPDSFTCFDMP